MICFAAIVRPLRHLAQTHGANHIFVHVAVFAFVFALMAGRRRLVPYTLLSLGLLLVGAFIEVVQSHVYGTPLEYFDIAYNGVGIAMGLIGRLALVR
jgi:hypothetical protein